MKNILLMVSFFFIGSISSCSVAEDSKVIEGISHHYVDATPHIWEKWSYAAYVPKGYKKEDNLPVIYLLHGANNEFSRWHQKGNGWEFQEMMDNLIETGQMPPTIVIMPDSRLGGVSWWVNYRFAPADKREDISTAFFEKLIPHIEESKFGTRSRTREERTVSGQSMGGFGTLHYVIQRSDMFKNAVVLSPGTFPTAMFDQIPAIPISDKEAGGIPSFIAWYKNYHIDPADGTIDSIYYKTQHYSAFLLDFATKQLPMRFYFITGETDEIGAVGFQSIDVQTIEASNPNAVIEAKIVPGVGHFSYKADVPFLEEGFKWMFKDWNTP